MIVLNSCVPQKELLYEKVNTASDDGLTSIVFPFSQQIANDNRYVLYLLDASCSMCIAKYLDFLKDYSINKYDCDSVYTIVYGCDDLLLLDYFKGQSNLPSIDEERYIIDKFGIAEKCYSSTNHSNFILLENNRIVFFANLFDYSFDSDLGYFKHINR